MKKNFSLFMVMVLILLPLSVYAGGGGQQSTSGSKPEISFTILDRGSVSTDEGTYARNRWVEWTNQNSPVTIRPVPVLRSESVQQIQALFMAGTAPDLVIEYGRAFMDGAYYQGIIQPVEQHIANYSTTYKAYLQKYPELLPYLTEDDGRQYAMSTRRGIEDLYNFCWWIRQDWLQKFNMPTPTNVNQLIDFMRRVKNENPSGIAGGDIGFVFRFLYIYDTQDIFGRPYKNFGVDNTGHYVDWTSTPGYRDWLAFMAQLYREGLMYPEFITDQTSTQMEQLRDVGRAGVYFGVRPSNTDGFFGKTLRRNVPAGVWAAMDPPATDYGRFTYGANPDGLPEYFVLMNSTARNPQAIMQYVDWMMQNWMTLTYGTEGRHYRLDNGVPITLDPTNTTLRGEVGYLGDWAFLRPRHEVQTPAWLYTQTVVSGDPLSVEYGTVMRDWFSARLNDKPLQYVPYLPASDAITRFETEVVGTGTGMTQVRQLEMGIITGQVPVDQGLQMINQYKNANGWAEVNAEKDAWYQRNKNSFRF